MYIQETLFSKSDLMMLASELLHQSPDRIAISYRVQNLQSGDEILLQENRIGFLISVVANDCNVVTFSYKDKDYSVDCCGLSGIQLFFNKVKVTDVTQLIYYLFEVL